MNTTFWKELHDNCAEKMHGGAAVTQNYHERYGSWYPELNGEPGFQVEDMLIDLANGGVKISGAFIKDPKKSSITIATVQEWDSYYGTYVTYYDVAFKTSLNTSSGQRTLL